MIIYNWKSNASPQHAHTLLDTVCKHPTETEIIIAPPAIYLQSLIQQYSAKHVRWCAQTISPFPNGAYTGETSAQQMAQIGCTHAMIGHSERRTLFAETDAVVAQKIQQALNAQQTPVLCVGESLPDTNDQALQTYLAQQIGVAIGGIKQKIPKLIVAYEPIWAIGSGLQAQAFHIQKAAEILFDTIKNYQNIENFYILYGGSVQYTTVLDILRVTGISGVLVGGASLKSDEIIKINQIINTL